MHVHAAGMEPTAKLSHEQPALPASSLLYPQLREAAPLSTKPQATPAAQGLCTGAIFRAAHRALCPAQATLCCLPQRGLQTASHQAVPPAPQGASALPVRHTRHNPDLRALPGIPGWPVTGQVVTERGAHYTTHTQMAHGMCPSVTRRPCLYCFAQDTGPLLMELKLGMLTISVWTLQAPASINYFVPWHPSV